MSNKEEEFPFEQFVEALQQKGDLRKKIKTIIDAMCDNNIYWVYSAFSTLIQIIKSKDEQPIIKCRSLETLTILIQTCQYSIITFAQLYLLPVLIQIANFRVKKTQQMLQNYLKTIFGSEDSSANKKLSLQYVERGVELLFYASKIKPFRTVETQQLKQDSQFIKAIKTLEQKGLEEPKKLKWCNQLKVKQHRKLYLQKLSKFGETSDEWTQFLLVNLIQEVRSGKKELLQLRLFIPYGQSFLTSALINFCEEQLMEMNQNLDLKRKYLVLLNEVIRSGDIEAIIMVKNSQVIPAITAHISKIPGHQGINQGQNIFPEVKGTKQVKRQFYVDFLRCLQTWAICLPEQYDSDEFNLKSIYQYLKGEKKFKFPQNLNLVRYQKQIKQNLQKNKQRNDVLLQILQNMDASKPHSLDKQSLSKVGTILQKTSTLKSSQLELKLIQVKTQMKNLTTDQPKADKAFKSLTHFKDNWINYLQTLDFETDDQEKLQNLVNEGQKYVEQIQLIVPLHASLSKGKMNYKQFKQRVIESLEFHNDVSQNNIHQKSKQFGKSIKSSKLTNSKFGKSKIASKMGKSLLQKLKAKSRMGDKTKMDISKVMDRSNMLQRSKYLEKSKLQRSKNIDISQKVFQNEPKPQSKINLHQIQPSKEEESSEQQQSITKSYKQPVTFKEIIKDQVIETPNKQKTIANGKFVDQNKQTSKKQTIKLEKPKPDSDEDEKIVRVDDYQVELQNKNKPPVPRLSHSRDKKTGSRILIRRNIGSKLDKSQDSKQSLEKRSFSNRSSSSKKIKQNSLFKKNQIQHNKTRKTSQIEAELKDKRIVSSQNIQVLDKNTKQPAATTERINIRRKSDKQFDKFNGDGGSISSIHSNSHLRVFRNSAQKILNITAQISQIKNQKEYKIQQIKQQKVEYFAMEPLQIPLVGDYFEEIAKKTKPLNLQGSKKSLKVQTKSLKVEKQSQQKQENAPQFKHAFSHKTQKPFSKEKKILEAFATDEKLKTTEHSKKSQLSRDQRKTTKQIRNKTQGNVDFAMQPRNSIKQIQSEKNIPEMKKKQQIVNNKGNQNDKESQIQALRKKILQLQRQSMAMKAKLAAKDNELLSIKNGSQKAFAHFTCASNSNYDRSSLRSSSASKKGEQTQFQKQVQIGFKQYLQKIKGNTFRKSLLKLKCLVHRTDEIQIGCLSQRGQNILQSTLYITPHRYNLLDFTVSIIHDNNLKIKAYPQSIKLITALKQQKIYITIEVLKLPFCLPQIEINYKADSEYSSNYNRLTLPLAFNKFCQIKPLDTQTYSQKHIEYVRTDIFKPNGKVIKFQKIKDSFTNFSYIPPTKNRQHCLLAASCQFSKSFFNLMINIHQKSSWIEGFLLSGDPKAMNFLICTLKDIIQTNKK